MLSVQLDYLINQSIKFISNQIKKLNIQITYKSGLRLSNKHSTSIYIDNKDNISTIATSINTITTLSIKVHCGR